MRKSKDSSKVVGQKQGGTNPYGQYRKSPYLPEDVRDFQLKEEDGIKVLEKESNNTAVVIGYDGPILELEINQAMTYSQRTAAKTGSIVPIPTIRSKFPMIAKYYDDDQVQVITCSEAGSVNAHKEAVSILAGRLQIKPSTVERYFRKPTTSKDGQ